MADILRGRDPNAPTRPVAAAAPRTEADVREFLRLLPRYRVVLYNDSHNTMDHVVSSLLRCVPSLIATVAERIMLEAHTTGRATRHLLPEGTGRVLLRAATDLRPHRDGRASLSDQAELSALKCRARTEVLS